MLFSRKWIKLLCCVLLLVPMLPAGNPAAASGGSWGDHADTSWYDTNYSTYIIDSAAKLAGVAKLVNDGTTDFSGKTLQIPASGSLSLADYDWVPIGNAEHPFKGILIGQAGPSPALTGLSVTDSVYAGLIGRMSGATVGRFTLSGSIQTAVAGNAAVGGVAGYMDEESIILDVTSEVSVQVTGTVTGNVYAGGIVGSGSGLLSNVANHGSIALGGSYWGMAGGVVAATNGVLTLKKNENTGPVSVSGSVYKADAGGIVGLASAPLFMADENTFIRNSGKIALLSVGSGSIGGIMGRVAADADVTFSAQTSNSGEILVNSGTATAGVSAGGLVGDYENTGGLNLSIPFVQTASAIVNKAGAGAYTGSIVGNVEGDFTWGQSVANTSSLTVGGTAEVYTGGVAGKVGGTAVFQAAAKNQAAIQVDASGAGVYTGGLVGFAGQRLLLHSSAAEAYGNTGGITVTGTASKVYTGGIVSNRSYLKAAVNVFSKGDIAVTGTERLYTGGFAGRVSDGDSGITDESYSGKITVASAASGTDNQVYTGGIVGYYGLGGVIENPVFDGEIKVSGGSGIHTGGVAGYITGGSAIVSAAIGRTAEKPALIQSSGDAGGVAGYADGTIQSAAVKYTEIRTSGTGGSAGGIAGSAGGRIVDAVIGDAGADSNDSLQLFTDASDSAVGGVVGEGRSTLVLGPSSAHSISLSAEPQALRSSLGGLAGKLSSGVSLSVQDKPFDIQNVTIVSAAAESTAGGVVGNNSLDLDSENLRAVSGISIDAKGDHSDLGGIVGRNSGQLTALTATDVTIKAAGAASRMGGVAGFTTGTIANPVITPGDGQLRLAAEGPDIAVGGVAGGAGAGAAVSGNGTDSNVSGLTVTSTAAASGARIGGIVGDSNASAIRRVVVESPVLSAAGADSMIGGLAGQMIGADIERSVVRGVLPDYAMLNVSASGAQAGGLAGRTDNAVIAGGGAAEPGIENLLLTGAESATGLYAGGIVGYNVDSSIGQVSGSTVKLTLKGIGATAGGVAGYNRGVAGYGQPAASRILKDNVMASLTILLPAAAASSITGGVVGLNDARSDEAPAVAVPSAISSIQGSKMLGSITVHGTSAVTGGLVGENRSVVAKNSISESLPVLSDGDKGLVGGLIGRNTGTMYYMYSNVVLTAGGVSSVIGGLAGENTGRVVSSYNKNDLKSSLSGTAGSYALLGGLIGRNSGSVDKSYTLSKITAGGAYTYVGGLIGDHSGSISNSYAGKDVSASGKGSYSGGLIGRITAGTVASSYSAGRITGEKGAYPGGFTGYYANASKNLIDDAYYVKDESLGINSGVLDFGGGTYNELNNYARLSPLLSSALADRKAFPVLSGWTFGGSPWRYSSDGTGYKYPELNLNAEGGDGGSETPSLNLNWYTQNPEALRFTIKTEEELTGLAAIVNGTAADVAPFSFLGRTVELTGPIRVSAAKWIPIGADVQHAFEGTFTGNHYLISDFTVNEAEYAGLFGVLGSDAVVQQVTVAPLAVTGSSYAGALAGLNLGKVEQAAGSLTGSAKIAGGKSVGGLIGRNEGQVSGLSVSISGGGGVTSSADGAYVGGLIGDSLSGLNEGSVTVGAGAVEAAGSNAAVGGLAGRLDGNLAAASLVIQDGGGIIAAGADSAAGGLVGAAESGTADGLSVSLSGGGVQASGAGSVAGGMFGRSAAGQVIRSAKVQGNHTPAAAINGSAAAGGIVGVKAGLGSSIFDIEAAEVRDVTVAATGDGAFQGGIAGKLTNTALKKAVFSGNLSATGSNATVGGIAGQATDSILYDLESSPQVKVSASTGVLTAGGVVGTLKSAKRDTPLEFGLLVPLYPGVYEAKLPAGSISINAAGQAAELYAGGIAGKMDSVSLYNSNSAVSLELSGGKTATAGGAAGYAKDSRMVGVDTASRIQTETSTNYNVGGLVGQSSGGSIAYARAQAANNLPIVIGESVAASRTASFAHAGGFVGLADGTDIQTSSATPAIQIDSANPYLTVYAGGFAGLLGESQTGTISVAYAAGQITADGAAGVYAGGFAGTVNKYRIEQAYASGNVSNTAFDARGGGFAGVIYQGSNIEDSYAAQEQVKVAGSNGATRSYAGGFAGYNDGSLSRVYERVSEVSAVAGGSNSYMGDFIGYNFRNGLVENSLYEGNLTPIKHDINSSGQSANLKPLSLTGYNKPDGWKFSGDNPVWSFAGGEQPYAPVLMGISNWRFAPDLGVITRAAKNQTEYAASTGRELAGLALLNDNGASVLALFDPAATAPLKINSIVLSADISLAGNAWIPVQSFNGVLDGKQHIIAGLNYPYEQFERYGLIADNNGTITNVKLQDAVVPGGVSTGVVAGVNHPKGIIGNVTVSGGSVSGTTAGGVAGDNQGRMSGITVENLKLAGKENAGGAAGSNTGQMEKIAVKGLTISSPATAGGIAGLNEGSIAASYTKAVVTASAADGSSAAGGIAGQNGDEGSISESFSYSDVAATAKDSRAGGIAGTSTGTIADSYNTGTIEAVGKEHAWAGGITGTAVAGTLSANVNGGQAVASVNGQLIKDRTFAGGIAGQTGKDTNLANNFFDVQMLQFPVAYYTFQGSKTKGAAGQAEGLKTTRLTGGLLPEGLKAAEWKAVPGFYPQLAPFSGSLDSDLSTVAVVLGDGDTAYKVRGSYKPTPDAAIDWKVKTESGLIYLTASKNDQSRLIVINKKPFAYSGTAAAPTSATALEFKDKTEVVLKSSEASGVIHYTVDGSIPSEDSPVYTKPIPLSNSAVIKAVTVVDGKNDSDLFTGEFKKLPEPGDNGGTGSGGSPGGGAGGIAGGGGILPAADTAFEILVNGKSQAVAQEKNTTENGRATTTVHVDEAALLKLLQGTDSQADISIVFSKKTDVNKVELSSKLIKLMAERKAVIRVDTGAEAFRVPAALLEFPAGDQAAVQLEIAAPDETKVKLLEQAAAAGPYSFLVKPVVFRAVYTAGDQTKEIERFSAYVERTITLPKSADSLGAIGVRVAADGSMSPLPTRIAENAGSLTAVIKSLTASGMFAVVAARTETSFRDVQTHWAKEAIADLAGRWIVGGNGEGSFEPERKVTRAEFSAMIVKALGLSGTVAADSITFRDVSAGAWYASSVQTASAYGLVSGYPDGSFGAQEPISRQQMMAILSRAMKLADLQTELTDAEKERLLKPFADAGSIAEYAKSGFAAGISAGLISGRSAKQLAPNDLTTRAEAASIIEKLLKQAGLI